MNEHKGTRNQATDSMEKASISIDIVIDGQKAVDKSTGLAAENNTLSR